MLSCRACTGLESALRASQIAKSPGSHLGSTSSPGSPTGKLVRSRQQNEHLKAEIHTLREAFEDIDGRNQALREEKQEVVRRLDDVQSRLHRETEGLFQQSAHSKSLTQQLQVYPRKSPLAWCRSLFCLSVRLLYRNAQILGNLPPPTAGAPRSFCRRSKRR